MFPSLKDMPDPTIKNNLNVRLLYHAISVILSSAFWFLQRLVPRHIRASSVANVQLVVEERRA